MGSSGPGVRRRARDDRGQAVVLLAISLLALLGLAAVVVDLGYAFLVDRRAQAAADASALGAALVLPDAPRAHVVSSHLAGQNFQQGEVALTLQSSHAANDTATAHATATVPSFFARVFGVGEFHVGATATARIGSYVGYAKALAPWVTDRSSLTFGTEVAFKVAPGDQASSGNFGSVRLPLQSKGCAGGSGTNDYRGAITGGDGVCLVRIGDSLATEPGNMGAVTGNALADRGATVGFDPSAIVAVDESGTRLTTADHPNLVVIPIIDSFGGGSSTVRVTGFAWFVITHYDKDVVEGVFVRSGLPPGAVCPTASDPNAGCPTGAYDPDGFNVVELIG